MFNARARASKAFLRSFSSISYCMITEYNSSACTIRTKCTIVSISAECLEFGVRGSSGATFSYALETMAMKTFTIMKYMVIMNTQYKPIIHCARANNGQATERSSLCDPEPREERGLSAAPHAVDSSCYRACSNMPSTWAVRPPPRPTAVVALS